VGLQAVMENQDNYTCKSVLTRLASYVRSRLDSQGVGKIQNKYLSKTSLPEIIDPQFLDNLLTRHVFNRRLWSARKRSAGSASCFPPLFSLGSLLWQQILPCIQPGLLADTSTIRNTFIRRILGTHICATISIMWDLDISSTYNSSTAHALTHSDNYAHSCIQLAYFFWSSGWKFVPAWARANHPRCGLYNPWVPPPQCYWYKRSFELGQRDPAGWWQTSWVRYLFTDILLQCSVSNFIWTDF